MANRPQRIIVHCSATPEGREHSAEDIDRWHRQRGWRGIGYHRVIRIDGTTEPGRPEDQIGAHTLAHNEDTLGVCYIGGIGPDQRPKDTRTPEQREALLTTVEDWCERYDIPPTRVWGHGELDDKKSCPCFDMAQFRFELIQRQKPQPKPPENPPRNPWAAALAQLFGGRA